MYKTTSTLVNSNDLENPKAALKRRKLKQFSNRGTEEGKLITFHRVTIEISTPQTRKLFPFPQICGIFEGFVPRTRLEFRQGLT